MSPILKLELGDEKTDFEVNLKYFRSHSTQQLFEKMIQRSNEIKEMLIRNGYRKPTAIIKRPSRPVRRNRKISPIITTVHEKNPDR